MKRNEDEREGRMDRKCDRKEGQVVIEEEEVRW